MNYTVNKTVSETISKVLELNRFSSKLTPCDNTYTFEMIQGLNRIANNIAKKGIKTYRNNIGSITGVEIGVFGDNSLLGINEDTFMNLGRFITQKYPNRGVGNRLSNLALLVQDLVKHNTFKMFIYTTLREYFQVLHNFTTQIINENGGGRR